jgi:hypothetical protein
MKFRLSKKLKHTRTRRGRMIASDHTTRKSGMTFADGTQPKGYYAA